MTGTVLRALFEELWPPHANGTRTFAVLDAARDPRIYPAVLAADCEWTCLYRGDAAIRMAEVAPYVLELDRYALFTSWLLENGWGSSWGIFLNAFAELELMRNHLRRLTMAQLPDGRTVYFRFYD